MRVVVLGTGALGCLVAARLARAGEAHVTLAGTWRAALDTIAARGVVVEEEGRAVGVRMSTAHRRDTLGPADFVLVLVKSTQTAAVAADAAAARSSEGLVVTLQNGLGNRELLIAAAGAEHVALGVATLGATLVAPGHVRAVPGWIALGAEGTAAGSIGTLAALLGRAGMPTTVEPDIDRLVWRKLAVNCAINPLAALRRVPNGALLDSAEALGLMIGAAREVGAVAAARGIDLGADPAQLAQEVARATASNRASMLQDVERGAPTEIDALCGAVVREGRRLGVATPLNEGLWRAILETQTRATLSNAAP